MALFTDAQLISFLFSFWLPAHIVHLIAFMFANKDDIYLDWKVFYLGDLAGWGLICGVTALLLNVIGIQHHWILYVYYGIHVIFLSTMLTDVSLYQESISLTNIKAILIETVVESILIPWGVGLGFGAIVAFIISLF